MSGDGTIVNVGLPITLSLKVYPYKRWCVTASADLTALGLTVSAYYQLCYITDCFSRKTLFTLGSWSGISWSKKLIERCG